ncbi:MAG: DEAD/DEAH box helicase [Acidimicrobiales bacterium]
MRLERLFRFFAERATMRPVTALLHEHLEGLVATFVPFDPPRGSWFALWDPTQIGGLFAGQTVVSPALSGLKQVDVEVVVPGAQRGTERVVVSTRKLPMVDATPLLSQLPANVGVDQTFHAWAAAIRVGLRAISRGLVLPWVSPDGWDTWRVDPLGPDDLKALDTVVASMPAYGHCTPVGTHRGQISNPAFAVRACFDALADRLIRSPAAATTTSSAVFAQLAPTRVRHLRPWVSDVAGNRCARSTLCLQVFPPESLASVDHDQTESDDVWRLVYQMRSAADPSLVVDAELVWAAAYRGQHNPLVERLGDSVDLLLLSALRRLGTSTLFADSLAEQEPTHLDLGADQLDQFLDEIRTIEGVVGLSAPGSELPRPDSNDNWWLGRPSQPPFGGRAMRSKNCSTSTGSSCSMAWPLTAAELQLIADAKRSIIPLRGRWVRLDGMALSDSEPNRLHSAWDRSSLRHWASQSSLAASVRSSTFASNPLCRFGSTSDKLVGQREAVEPNGFRAELRPYQRTCSACLTDLADLGLGGVLADDMGLGKTVQLLALHQHRQGPTLVVCPTTLLTN